MTSVLGVFDLVLGLLRPAFFWAAIALAVMALLDWLVRTRRISPFSGIGRFARGTIDPLFKPVERAVVRAGGNPVMAPFWALALAVLGGIVLISLLEFVRDQLVFGMSASQSGIGGMGVVLLHWLFQIMRLALLVRVVCSWVRVSPFSKWVRWAFVLTEPLLRPLRQVIPTIGMVDITPIVLYFVLGLLERVLVRGLMG